MSRVPNTDILVVECGLESLAIDEAAFPDHDRHYIYDHLKHCLSKSKRFPAVTVSAEHIPPVIVAGHKYFRTARELGVASIRAVVIEGTPTNSLRAFLCRQDVRIIDISTIAQEMNDTVVMEVWHVFFFERPLTNRDKADFEARIAEFFRTISSSLLAGHERRVSQVTYSFSDTCAEFTAVTPIGDEGWYGDYLRACTEFSSEVVKITSYQGGRFG